MSDYDDAEASSPSERSGMMRGAAARRAAAPRTVAPKVNSDLHGQHSRSHARPTRAPAFLSPPPHNLLPWQCGCASQLTQERRSPLPVFSMCLSLSLTLHHNRLLPTWPSQANPAAPHGLSTSTRVPFAVVLRRPARPHRRRHHHLRPLLSRSRADSNPRAISRHVRRPAGRSAGRARGTARFSRRARRCPAGSASAAVSRAAAGRARPAVPLVGGAAAGRRHPDALRLDPRARHRPAGALSFLPKESFGVAVRWSSCPAPCTSA